MSSISDLLKPAAFVALPHIGGIAGGFITKSEVPKWYRGLKKAPWSPPEWAFAPVWTGLYTGMGYASWLVYKEVGLRNSAMYLYGAQLALNWAWTPLFFGAHRIGLGCIELLATLGLVAACTREFLSINPTAGKLMLPYLAWGCLAATLNFYMWLYNDNAGSGRTLQAKAKK